MNDVVNEVLSVAKEVAPQNDVVQVGEAIAVTVANPSPEILVEDVILAHKVANDVKTAFAGKHPGLWDLFCTIFHLGN